MPELPEVETIRQQIAPIIRQSTIVEVHYSEHAQKLIKGQNFHLEDLTFEDVGRHGKILVFHFKNDLFLISHLGMSGTWIIGQQLLPAKHHHLQLTLKNNQNQLWHLHYFDPRRFGRLAFLNAAEKQNYLGKYGVDIEDAQFSAEYIYHQLQRFPKKILKPFLLDQNHFSGIGNYLASEICARAGILPTRQNGTISFPECQRLQQATIGALHFALQGGGTTFAGGYLDGHGNKGDGLKHLVVFYQETCGLCRQHAVEKIILQGRGTYYCPNCQI